MYLYSEQIAGYRPSDQVLKSNAVVMRGISVVNNFMR